MNVVDSPPGTTSPSSPSSWSGLRTSTACAPSRRSMAACSRKFPWRARTPIFMMQILDFGYRRPGAARVEQREGDEQEAGEREDNRSRPFVRVGIPEFAVEPGKQHEREQREEQEPAGGGNVRPLVGEVDSRL